MIPAYKPQVLVVDLSAVPDIEYTALKMLTELEQKRKQQGITFWLPALIPELHKILRSSSLGNVFGSERLFFNFERAVEAYQAQYSYK